MPHKHKRRRDDHDEATRDLPPSATATSLPTRKDASGNAVKRRKRASNVQDDTPKAFARIMRFRQTGKRVTGLDDGVKPSKKRKVKGVGESAGGSAGEDKPAATSERPADVLKIQPGESMSSFSARVYQALPVARLAKKGKKLDGVKPHRTRLEKKITKRQDEWRKNEAKRIEKEEEARDRALEEDTDGEAPDYWADTSGKRKSKRQRRQGGATAEIDDPWAVLKEAREKPKGVFDVVQAPPSFKKLPTEKFRVMDGRRVGPLNVPTAAGSVRTREALGEARKSIIESYRTLMHTKQIKAVRT